MISLAEAEALIDRHTRSLDSVSLSIEKSIGHVIANDLISPANISPFRNSAMDGFAVVTKALTTVPNTRPIIDTAYAGGEAPRGGDRTSALKIMTGAAVPEPYDAVVRFEDTTYDGEQVTIKVPVRVGDNIRQPGEDFQSGETVLAAGSLIKSLYTGVLASIGMPTVEVIRKPRVLVISTGDELVASGVELSFGQLYDSNSPTVASMIRPFCSSVERITSVSDDRDQLVAALRAEVDVIISTGGVSAGEKDYVPEAAEQAGWSQVFHKARIKPGKPILFATQKKRLFFGLPGNPLSAAVTCAMFVIPALKCMMGILAPRPTPDEATLAGSPFKSGRTVIWPGSFHYQHGEVVARFSEKRSSAALSALIGSDGLIIQEPWEGTRVSSVQVIPWAQILTW